MREALLDWYDANRRRLPWREDPTPYHVWLSEIMLQQTRVEAVKGYYARFLAALPDIAALANAPEEQCLKLWEGLGYYSRVRNMRKAAAVIMEEHGGEMPRTAVELKKLPGIGEYTAAAIASIAFGERAPALDGNLLRIFARMTEYSGVIRGPEAGKCARSFFLSDMPDDRPGDYNQALMDLGATVCLPGGEPLCGECPWRERCMAHAAGKERAYPVMPAKAARRKEERTVLVIRCGGRIALRRRPEKGLLAGVCEFPNEPGKLSGGELVACIRRLGFEPEAIRELGAAKHVFSHIEWHMTGYAVEAVPARPESGSGPGRAEIFLAAPEEISRRYPIPSAFSAYRNAVTSEAERNVSNGQ